MTDPLIEVVAQAIRSTREFQAGAAFGIPVDARNSYLQGVAGLAVLAARTELAAQVAQMEDFCKDDPGMIPREAAVQLIEGAPHESG